MRYFEFTGDEHRVYPARSLEVDPGQIVGFASGSAPDSRWKASSKKQFDEQQADEAPVVEDHTPNDPDTPDVSVDPPAAPADQSSPAA